MNNNEHNHITPMPSAPVTALGKLLFEIDLDTEAFKIMFEHPSTMQLIPIQLIQNILPMYGIKLLVEEYRRQSKKVIVV